MEKFITLINKKSNSKGMTLVEVLIASTVLVILIVAFTNLIGFNFINIFVMGEKSKAIAEAIKKTDQLYVLVHNAENAEAAVIALENPDNGWVEFEDLYDKNFQECVYSYRQVTGKEIDGTLIDGYEVTVVVFYNNFTHHVSLDSFIVQTPSGTI